MAEGTATAGKSFGFLSQKTGPLPLWVWMAGGIGVWYYLNRSKTSSSSTGAPNQQTDPAGNIGSIDPATGYVYGTPEDTAALAANNAGGGAGGGTGTAPGSQAQTYTDNNAWASAAINYLVGLGVDPTQANQAITLYLSSQSLTTQQQALVNQAIQALGAPPSLPGPTSNNPGQVVSPPGSSNPPGTKTPPPNKTPGPPKPTGKAPGTPSVSITGTTSTSVSARWNKVPGATRYNVRITYQSKVYKTTSTSTTSVTVNGLRPDSSMDLHVSAVNSSGASSETTNSFHTSK